MSDHLEDEYHDDHDDHPSATKPDRVTSLCLTRKPGQGVLFYGPVSRIVVQRTSNQNVRFIIHAPRSTRILRDEHIAESSLVEVAQ